MNSESMKLVNLTPHPLVLWRDDEVVATWPGPADETRIPRVAEPRVGTSELVLGGVSVSVAEVEPSLALDPVPSVVAGTVYVVSRLAAMAVPGRQDVLFPIEYRDTGGALVGCSGFGRFVSPMQEDHR